MCVREKTRSRIRRQSEGGTQRKPSAEQGGNDTPMNQGRMAGGSFWKKLCDCKILPVGGRKKDNRQEKKSVARNHTRGNRGGLKYTTNKHQQAVFHKTARISPDVDATNGGKSRVAN